MKLKPMFLIVVLFTVLLSLYQSASGSVRVVIKPNAGNPVKSDVFIKDSKTGKLTKFRTIAEVYRSHYHPAEYHQDYLYIIKRSPGGDLAYEKSSKWTDELWRYSRDGAGTKLWSARGLDFRINDSGDLAAVLSNPDPDTPGQKNLYLLNTDGKLLKTFNPKGLASTEMSFERWSGQYLWIKDQEEIEISGLVRIDAASMATKTYDLSGLDLQDEDYDLNTQSLKLAFTDYPFMFDTDTAKDFVKHRTPVKLFVYDLGTKRNLLVARSIAKPFHPKWINTGTLDYDNPKGKGRVRQQIR